MASLDSEAQAGAAERRRSPLRLALQALSVALVLALLALLVWRVLAGAPGHGLLSDIRAGKAPPAPAFDLPVIWAHTETWPALLRPRAGDGRVALSELRGRPVVINFWASWCVPCKKEAPLLAASARRHAGAVVFLGIDVQDFKSDARGFLRKYGANYVSIRDPGPVYRRYGLTGVPETYYLDRAGRILRHSVGQLSGGELEAAVAQIEGRRRG